MPTDHTFDRINALLAQADSKVRVHGVRSRAPLLEFQPAPTMLPLACDRAQAQAYRAQQFAANRVDDPHVIVDDVGTRDAGDSPVLPVAVVEYYSELRADAHREQRLVVGASSLVLRHDGACFLFQLRGRVESGARLVHTFGGGYMPYRPSQPVERANRRDDRKDLLRTAQRELVEESAIEAERSDYLPDLVFELEERWAGKFGHLTFAFVLPLRGPVVAKGSWEGRPVEVPIEADTLFEMIVAGEVQTATREAFRVHPQLRGLLYAWLHAGAPGLPAAQRLRLDAAGLKRRVDAAIDLHLRRREEAAMSTESRPVVYVSYAWMTVEQNGRPVREPDPRGKALADRLRAAGVDVRLDVYAHEGLHGQRPPLRSPDDPRDPWHAWASQQVAEADVVLMLCTPDYVQPESGEPGGAFEQWSALGLADRIGAGARALWWDWLAIAAECRGKPQKFIPVGWGPYDAGLVPGFVRGATYQNLDKPTAMDALLRRIRQVWHERVPRSGVFVSYAHDDDGKWLESLLARLQPLADRERVPVWTDRDIAPGDDWHLRIQNALDRARIGVMLVSPQFLKSSYITSDELPKMLGAAESEGLKIFWVPLVRTETAANPIARFQAAHAPDKPLAELGKAAAGKALNDIVARLAQLLGITSP